MNSYSSDLHPSTKHQFKSKDRPCPKKADKLREILNEVEQFEKDLDVWLGYLNLPTHARDQKGTQLYKYPISAKVRQLERALDTYNKLNEEAST